MKIKNILYTLSLMLCTQWIVAQEGLPFYEHYLVADKYLINPSYAGADPEIMRVKGTYYSQWSGIEDAPSTQTLGAHATIINRLAGGFYVFNDRNGATSMRGINLTAAYHIPIGDQFSYTDNDEENKFSFGLSYTGISQIFDRTKWNAQNPNDPLLEDDTYFLNYFNIGGSFNYNGIYGAVSVLDMPLGDNRAVVNTIEPLPTNYYLLAGYKFRVAEGIKLEPSFLLNLNSNSERQMDIAMKSHFDLGGNALSLGVNYRTDTDENGSQSLSLSPLINLEIGKLRIGYAYRMGLTDIYQEAGNGHLISLGFDFGNPFQPYY